MTYINYDIMFTRIGKRMWLVISTVFSKLKAFSRSQVITYTYKNWSGDEIANVNFLRRYGTHTSKYQKKNLPRLIKYKVDGS